MSDDGTAVSEGGCLCGEVRYRIVGPVRDVIVCHCSVCRRAHGGPAPHAACRREQLEILAEDTASLARVR